MNNLNPDVPAQALVPPTDIERLFTLLALIIDPKATQKRLEEIATASAQVREMLIDLGQRSRDLAGARDNLKRDALAEQDKLLAAGRETLEQEKRRREEDFSRREVEIAARDKASRDNFDSTMKLVQSVKTALAVE